MVRIAGLPVWGPSDMIAGARALVGWTDDAVGVVTALPERISALLDDVELLVGRIGAVADRADTVLAAAETMVGRLDPLLADVRATADDAAALITRAGAVADGAAGVITTAGGVADSAGVVIAKATSVADSAGVVVEEAAGASRSATELLALYEPLARRGAPLAQRFVDELSEAEVDAAIRLIDQVPQFTEHMETDIMPILATLDRVGPDVHELLDVLKDVRLAIQGLPGFSMLRRRGERQESE